LIPTASRLLDQSSPAGLVKQSRGAAFILTLAYALFLYCQLKTHRIAFLEESRKVEAEPLIDPQRPEGGVARGLVAPAVMLGSVAFASSPMQNVENIHSSISALAVTPGRGEHDDVPELHFGVAVALFLALTTLLYFCIDFAVHSVDALTASAGVSKTFVALILLPLPNCDLSPVMHALEDDMDVTVTYTVGKCLQTALLVTPLCVLLSWGLGTEDVMLAFDGFAVVSLFAAVLLLNFLIVEAKVTW
jgi:Ca2+:H+ antiporter